MQVIKRENALVYEIDPKSKPVLTVKPGEKFKVETEDNFEQEVIKRGNGPFTEEELPRLKAVPFNANPLAGPIYIEGIEEGDLLAIHIWDIVPGEKGWTGTLAGAGILQDKAGWEDCFGNYGHIIKNLPGPSGTTSDGTALFEINNHKWTWKLNPHIGTILTAPQKGRGVVNSLTCQGPYGGNQDIRDVCKGNTVYLNSFNQGGLLFVGDVHASMGDSELTGIANETYAEVVLSVDIIKNKRIPGTARIETPDSIIQCDSCANSGTHAFAMDNCFVNMMKWLVEDYGFSKKEAYLHMTANPGTRVNVYQMSDPFFVCGVQFPKKFLT
ncbi:MAG: acetamidase/formamidase family protein [Oscillospiraceae bacterium]|nr:acetamidase/formamidase family protein [Oscillospiraceae bacterium]